MERYPEFSILSDTFDTVVLDGRRNSRTLDGRARVQIMQDELQYEFTITHPNLKKHDVKTLLDFYRDNLVIEFEFYNPDDDQVYICMFYSPPVYSDYIVDMKNVTFTLAGYPKNG